MTQDATRLDFPTMEQVEKGDKIQLAKWYRFLPAGSTAEQQKIMDRIVARFEKLGGMTPQISDKIGYGGVTPPPPRRTSAR